MKETDLVVKKLYKSLVRKMLEEKAEKSSSGVKHVCGRGGTFHSLGSSRVQFWQLIMDSLQETFGNLVRWQLPLHAGKTWANLYRARRWPAGNSRVLRENINACFFGMLQVTGHSEHLFYNFKKVFLKQKVVSYIKCKLLCFRVHPREELHFSKHHLH